MLSDTLTKYCNFFLRNIDKNEIRFFLESSPHYPNLLSIIQTLQYMGLKAHAGQCEWKYFKNLESPFLLHLKIGKREMLLIASWNNESENLRVYNIKKNKWEIRKQKDLEHSWDGVVIYTDEKQVNEWYDNKVNWICIFILLCLLLICRLNYNQNINILCYFPILIGFTISIYIYLRQYISSDMLLSGLCNISVVTDCDSVEESAYSVIFGIKMSALATSFFLSQLICVAIASLFLNGDILYSLYFITSTVFLPTTVYSIYGQSKTRKLCLLCIIIIACLFIEVICFLFKNEQDINFRIILLWGCIFITLIIFSKYISDYKEHEEQYIKEHIELLKIKRKKEFICTESEKVGKTISPIWLGKEISLTNVTTIISPSCSQCKKVNTELLALIEKGYAFRWNLILGHSSKSDTEIIKDMIMQYLLNKETFQDKLTWSKCAKLLISTYKSRESIDSSRIMEISQTFSKQISDLGISYFPKIIINGYLLSSTYNISDIKYIITDQVFQEQ